MYLIDKPNTRGERNNNPGNLRANPNIHWQGQGGKDAAGFMVFQEVTGRPGFYWGIRALARDLLVDYTRDRQRSVKQLISEFAPHSENDTHAYINAVARILGVMPDDPLDLAGNFDQLTTLVWAIIRIENGRVIYPGAVIDAACRGAMKGLALPSSDLFASSGKK